MQKSKKTTSSRTVMPTLLALFNIWRRNLYSLRFRNHTLSKTLKRTARTLYTNTYINKSPFWGLLILLYYLKYPYYVWEDNKAINWHPYFVSWHHYYSSDCNKENKIKKDFLSFYSTLFFVVTSLRCHISPINN